MKITVLMGGTSAERDVSLASGVRIAQALRRRGHDVISLDTARGVIESDEEAAMLRGVVVKTQPPSLEQLRHMTRASLSPSLGTLPAIREVDVVFLALHGGQGEDGTLQALLDMAGVRYTGSGQLGSALAMDKDLSKHLFRAHGVTTADWMMITAEDELTEGERRFDESGIGLPVVVKPSKQGSTVGLSVVRKRGELGDAVREALRFDDEVMLEQFVPGRELTVSVLGTRALPVGEIFPKHEIYDYECKYTQGMAVEEFPAKLSASETQEIQRQAMAAFRALKLGGYARVDFRMSPEGEFNCLEANTLPGMTQFSLLPQAAAADGVSFDDLCERIALLALERKEGSRT